MWREIEVKKLAYQGKENFVDGDWIEAPYIVDEGVRLIQTGNIGVGKFRYGNKKYISDHSFEELRCKEVKQGDILICRLAEPAGRSCIVPKLPDEKLITSVDVTIFRVNETEFDKDFILQAINTNEFLDRCLEVSGGTTRTRISRTNLGNLTVSVPYKDVQKKIGSILRTTDDAIEKTQALIAKYENIKQGMMQDLFSRGVDENGQLRPSYDDAPHLYQETVFGWLPKGWVIKPAFKICSAVIDCKNRTPPVLDYGHPVIRTPNVRDGRFVYDDLVFTDESSYEIWTARGKPEAGDVLITREAPFGETCLIPDVAMKACLGQRMMLYKVDPQKINNQFMCSVIQTSMMQDYLLRLAGGSTVGHIRVGDIRELLIPHPENVNEQEEIANKILGIEDKLATEQENLQKLSRIKLGLMQDLLTGKVRVAEDMEERKEAVA